MRRANGFTLIEMLVVIVIIGTLMALIIPRLVGGADKAKVTTTEGLINQLSGEVDLFKLDHSRYPERLDDLVLMPSYVDAKKWPPGGYRKKTVRDAWGREFVFRVPGTNGQPYDLVSLGEDGREGGEGYAADLWNHESYKR